LFFTDIYEEQSGEGEIDDINEDSIIVSGIPIQVDPSTEINEPLFLGDRVKYSAIRDLDADTETALVARRITPTQETRVEYIVKKEGMLLQVRISEPIHPDDMERYERLHASLEAEAPLGDTTISDKRFTESDIISTKDDYIETKGDEAISEIDKDPTESDTSLTEGDIEPTETDIKRTDSDALRPLLRDSPKTHSKEESYKQQLQEHTYRGSHKEIRSQAN
jgi:hypothetical protein